MAHRNNVLRSISYPLAVAAISSSLLFAAPVHAAPAKDKNVSKQQENCSADGSKKIKPTLTAAGTLTGCDRDGDGLQNHQETRLGTDPALFDTDGDGWGDGGEVKQATDPLVADGEEALEQDSDNDGLTDEFETQRGTNPFSHDTDSDELKDGEELNTYLTDPLAFDTDSDGMNDGEEALLFGTSPVLWDTDGDGVSDFDEIFIHGTDPFNA